MNDQGEKLAGKGRPPRSEVYRRLDTQIAELWNRLGGLPSPIEAEGIWKDIWTAEAHHSTALEGNTLVIREVEQLLNEGRAVGAKQLREYMEVRGYANAADWVYREGIQPTAHDPEHHLTMQDVRHVHRDVMALVWDVEPHPDATPQEGPGSFRQHEIAEFGDGMKPVSWPLVEAEMASWLAETNRITPRSPEFCEQIAKMHRDFEAIHPFLDGNGRTGRVLNLLLLVEQGLLEQPVLYLSRHILRQRVEYYRLLLAVSRDGAWQDWIAFMLDAVTQTAHWTADKIRAIQQLHANATEYVRTHAPKIYSRELVDALFVQPYCRIQNLVKGGIAKRQTASVYLKQLAELGMLVEVKVGREKLFLHPNFVRLLTSDDHPVLPYGGTASRKDQRP